MFLISSSADCDCIARDVQVIGLAAHRLDMLKIMCWPDSIYQGTD